MQLYELQVTRTTITRSEAARIPKGIIGAVIRIRFSPEWENLKKTVVFRAGDITKDILNVEEFAVIPAECTQELGQLLEVGVYGVDGENTVAIPTVWAAIGRITEATDPSGDTSTDPTLPVWAKLQERIRFLEETGVSQGQLEKAVEYYLLANPFTADDVGAAPAGYGLGDNAQRIDSWNNAKRNGFYVSSYGGPDGDGNEWHGIVSNYNTSLYNQLVWKSWGSGSIMATRRILEGEAPEAWEWINPPMAAGVEYLTTERFSNKPVFAKLISTRVTGGSTSGTSYVNVPHDIQDYGISVRNTGRTGTAPLPMIHMDTSVSVYQINTTNIQLSVKNSYLDNKAFVFVLYYTKS